jgi:hypothetical protein
MLGNSWVAAQLAASEEELIPVELVTQLIRNYWEDDTQVRGRKPWSTLRYSDTVFAFRSSVKPIKSQIEIVDVEQWSSRTGPKVRNVGDWAKFLGIYTSRPHTLNNEPLVVNTRFDTDGLNHIKQHRSCTVGHTELIHPSCFIRYRFLRNSEINRREK